MWAQSWSVNNLLCCNAVMIEYYVSGMADAIWLCFHQGYDDDESDDSMFGDDDDDDTSDDDDLPAGGLRELTAAMFLKTEK